MCEELSTGDLSVNIDQSKADIHVECECGEELDIDLKGWSMLVKGGLVFKCPSCPSEISTYNVEYL